MEITLQAKKILDEAGINPEDVKGTGPDGKINKADAENYLTELKRRPPEPAKEPEVKEPEKAKESEPEKPKSKIVTVKENIQPKIVQKSDPFTVKDFFNHPETTIRNDGATLHLVRFNGQIRWMTRPNVVTIMRRNKPEIVTNGTSPVKSPSLEFPRNTTLTGIIEQCKDCR